MPSITTPSAEAAQAVPQTSIHKPFSWLHDSLAGNPHAEFMALTRNICNGAVIIADAAHVHALDQEADQSTIFSINQMERLSLMATGSLKLLADMAEREIEWLNDRARSQVQS